MLSLQRLKYGAVGDDFMSFDSDTLKQIYDRTEGKCHLCRKKLAFANYALAGRRGAWEIEHSVPRSKGGTDRLNNLYDACIGCNRSKCDTSTRTIRSKNGFKCAPYSKSKRSENTWIGGTLGAVAAIFLVPPPIRLGVMLLGAVIGAVVGHEAEPD
jgi:hypothetical protein